MIIGIASHPWRSSLSLPHRISLAARTLTSTPTNRAKAPESLLRLESLKSESDHALARTWLDGFGVDDIPKEAWEASYSRSSGPGGQVRLCPSPHNNQ